jgi:hypothetical protein
LKRGVPREAKEPIESRTIDNSRDTNFEVSKRPPEVEGSSECSSEGSDSDEERGTKIMTPPAGARAKQETNLEVIQRLLNAKGWDDYLPYLSPDLFVKVGAEEPLHGPEAYHQFMGRIYSKLRFINHDVRGMWEIGNVVIVEMDVNYEVIEDGRPATVPCVDIYRFEDGVIKEWRIYPDASKLGIQV